ncbi:hypothetical protein thsps21_39110 [Pseudomonas sp. No.21]|jgi:hypothetical protein|nr:hypothetical protein TUM20249_52440 [Pseudomonas tohonis]
MLFRCTVSDGSELERYQAGAAAEAEFTPVNEHSKADPYAVPPTRSRADRIQRRPFQ